MVPAAVGFQCPTCVTAGRRETRSGRTAYGGTRSDNPAATSVALIALNVAVWVLVVATGGPTSPWLRRLALWREDITLRWPDGIHTAAGVSDGAWWQLVTSAFTHVEPWHIGFNMLALWFLGPQLEAAIGRWRFLALYLGSALSGSALVYWFAAPATYTLGASGAVFGLMAALLIVALKVRCNVQPILAWIGINAVITVLGAAFISWEGHLGGFLGGLALMAAIVWAPRSRRTAWQLAGFALVGVVVLALVATRTAALA